jgi:acyl-homoserine-lactone acylase
MRKLVCASVASLALLSACSEEPVTQTAVDSRGVEIRWTSYGIPHIKAENWEGLGFGLASAVATNTVCVLARELITVRGEQARYFGDSERNINNDAFHKALLHSAKLDEYLNYGSDESKSMDRGFVDGYNHFVSSHQGQFPATCNNQPWVKAIDLNDLARLAIGTGIRYGLGRVTEAIVTAAPGTALAALTPLDLQVDVETIGSNAVAFGRELTDNGRGILLGNPHYPWQGASRFHLAHLTLPGELDVMGVGLIASPRIAIGFSSEIAWSHTVSTALRFTMFRLDLVPGDPMAYSLGDEIRNIEVIDVEVETPSGLVNRTAYMTHLGPVVASDTTPWTDQYVYVMRDVNYENYRGGDQYQAIQQAHNVAELKAALGKYQGAAFVNTIAADSSGGALYADMSAIPNVSAELLERCDAGDGGRIITLNGSDPSCDWQVDPEAAAPGLMPPSQQPSLITEKYVTNSNDSYWLSNPDMRLEGFSPIIGNEQSTRSLRTRAGLNLVEEILNSGEPVNQSMVQGMLFEHRNYGAELLLDDILTVCQLKHNSELTEACDILSNWDRRQDVTSVGAHIYNEFWIAAARGINAHFAVPFDVDDPVHTPRGLTIDSSETQDFIDAALTTAVTRLQEANVSLDAKWGDVQFALRNGEKIGIPGGGGGSGMFSVITARLDAETQGYNPITHGNSYIQAVSWNEDGSPDARAIITYSQSPEPDSDHYADMTRLYSKSQWISLPFTDEQIAAELLRVENF